MSDTMQWQVELIDFCNTREENLCCQPEVYFPITDRAQINETTGLLHSSSVMYCHNVQVTIEITEAITTTIFQRL